MRRFDAAAPPLICRRHAADADIFALIIIITLLTSLRCHAAMHSLRSTARLMIIFQRRAADGAAMLPLFRSAYYATAPDDTRCSLRYVVFTFR